MSHKWSTHILGGFLATALALATIPALADSDPLGESPVAASVDANQLNPDYLDWLADGQQGLAPSAQDFSYLTDSYAALIAAEPAVNTRAGSAPSSYDLRDYGLVDPVSDQGDLGICWAIAANSAASGHIRDQFPQLTLSAMHTAWFCYTGDEEEEFSSLLDPYQTGGNDSRAVGTMAAWKGPVNESKAPLNTTRPPRLAEALRYDADYHLQDAYYMPSGIYAEVSQDLTVAASITKQLIMNVGPVPMCYYSNTLANYNETTHAVYNSTAKRTDHAVLIIGWDDNYSRENFRSGNRPQHDGAWLARNSWGTEWGDDGYFWISYEDKSLVTGNAYLLEEADNYTTNYQYDITGWSYSVQTDLTNPTTGTAANIFTASSDEQLEAVSFYTTDAGARYSISIYTGVSDGQPQSGTLQLSGQTGRETYAGYHTIELDKPVTLRAGERFSVVVTFTNPSYDMPIAVEWCPMPSQTYVPAYMGSGGESYIVHNGRWRDIAGDTGAGYYITNVCIKAFTNPLPASGSAVATVRFSEMEGPLADGTSLTLSTADDSVIYWSSGGAYQRYTGAIALDSLDNPGDSITISAYAEAGGQRGNTVSKTYTRAAAQLTDLAVDDGETITHLDITERSHTIALDRSTASVRVMAQSGDTITVNGAALDSADWSRAIGVAANGITTITVAVQGSGKTATSTTLYLTRDGSEPPAASDLPFTDVAATAWYYDAVTYVFNTGLMSGTSDTTFAPDWPVSRAMVWSVLARQAGANTTATGDAWYSGAQAWAIANGVTDGLRPDDSVSREELATMLHRYEGRPAASADLSAYTDASTISDWARDAMQWIVSEGIIGGVTATTLEPQLTTPRAQLAAILQRYTS